MQQDGLGRGPVLGHAGGVEGIGEGGGEAAGAGREARQIEGFEMREGRPFPHAADDEAATALKYKSAFIPLQSV